MLEFYTIKELWNGEWWTWHMYCPTGSRLEAKPIAFIKDPDDTQGR